MRKDVRSRESIFQRSPTRRCFLVMKARRAILDDLGLSSHESSLRYLHGLEIWHGFHPQRKSMSVL